MFYFTENVLIVPSDKKEFYNFVDGVQKCAYVSRAYFVGDLVRITTDNKTSNVGTSNIGRISKISSDGITLDISTRYRSNQIFMSAEDLDLGEIHMHLGNEHIICRENI